MIDFVKFTRTDISKMTAVREGECKVGQTICIYEDLDQFDGKYVVVGVEESIGPQANFGFTGAENGFSSFLSRFLNVQSNRFFSGNEVLIYGVFKLDSIFDSIDEKRKLISELDSVLILHLELIYNKGFVPILIGGGHNNAYPLMKAFANVKGNSLNVINCDPHADYRLLEGRHSGNSFSYAKSEGVLNYYKVIGLHQSYNSEEMLSRMEVDGCDFTFFDDYLIGIGSVIDDVEAFVIKNNGIDFGVELDLDAVKGMPSSAYSFSGISVEEARSYLIRLAEERRIAYLHLPEGAPKNDRDEVIVGKTLAYLVTDFIKSNSKKKDNIKC
jgi:formiminoglutamase